MTNAAGDHGLTQTGLRLQLEPAWPGTILHCTHCTLPLYTVMEELVLLYINTPDLQPRVIIDSTPLPSCWTNASPPLLETVLILMQSPLYINIKAALLYNALQNCIDI